MQPTITETDWELFDGFTLNFAHPSLSRSQLHYLLGSAYTRFYIRPSFLANFLRIQAPQVRRLVTALDARVARLQSRIGGAAMTRAA
jgi:hypothetical protein